tara:strand:+ start:915 stop:3149 length:2235 start_codon:yes stop_codon:yes gene_type:complete
MALPLLLKIGDGGTGPYKSLESKIGATFAPETQRMLEGPSPHISSQSPSFVESDHPIFVNFLEAYYEWLEQKVNVFGRTVLLQDISDIDKTLDEYVIHFKRQFLLNFPETLATDPSGNVVDERTMLKNIKDFYQTKGSEKSYELLFRLLYDSACDFYYPKQDILRLSDGQWTEEKAIKITSSNGVKNFKIAGNNIEQKNRYTGETTASAKVHRVHQYNIGPHEVTELFVENIVGTFSAGETITCTLSDGTVLSEIAFGLFSDLQVDIPGLGYDVGDRALVYNDEYINEIGEEDGMVRNTGEGGKGKVNEVSLKGEIKKAVVDNAGVNYTEPLAVIFEGGDGNARATMYPKALVSYPGYYKNNNGKLSSNKKIQDGHYYQDYSYVLKAEISLDTYKEVLKKLIHPAGLRVFGNISILKSIQSDQPFHSEHQSYEMPIVGHYTPYRFQTTNDLRSNGVTTPASGPGAGWSGATGGVGNTADLYSLGYNPGATQNYHCFGNSGGKLIVRGPSLTAGSFPVGLQVSGDTSGASGEVLSWDVYQGTGGVTLGVLHLLQTRDMRPNGWRGPAGAELGELIGVTNAGHASGTAAGGWTAEICAILDGSGIVSESLTDGTTLAGLIAHDPTNIPLGTAGTDGYTSAQEYYRATGLAGSCGGATAYNYWEIYHHPNSRGFSGQYIAGGWTLGIGSGISFDRVQLKEFFKMAVGMHFHSDPSSDSLYYDGSSSDSIYYSVPYGSTSGSPNLTTI